MNLMIALLTYKRLHYIDLDDKQFDEGDASEPFKDDEIKLLKDLLDKYSTIHGPLDIINILIWIVFFHQGTQH